MRRLTPLLSPCAPLAPSLAQAQAAHAQSPAGRAGRVVGLAADATGC